jgi:hypothetical protein
MYPFSWSRQAADSSFKYSEIADSYSYFLECLSLLKDYDQHLRNFVRLLFLSSAVWQQLAVAVGLCQMTGSNTCKVMNTTRNGQNHAASVSCTKQFYKKKCRFSYLCYSPDGRQVKMQVSTSLLRLYVGIR